MVFRISKVEVEGGLCLRERGFLIDIGEKILLFKFALSWAYGN